MGRDDVETDERLAVLAERGDRRAFARLVNRYGRFVAQTARGFGVPETDVDDVVQETFLTIWRKIARFDPERSFRAWMFQVAANRIRDLLRYRKVRNFLFNAMGYEDAAEADLAALAPGADRELFAHRQLAQVQAVLDRFDRVSREVFTLHALVGLTQAETAEALGLSVKAVEARIMRSRQKIADHFAAAEQTR